MSLYVEAKRAATAVVLIGVLPLLCLLLIVMFGPLVLRPRLASVLPSWNIPEWLREDTTDADLLIWMEHLSYILLVVLAVHLCEISHVVLIPKLIA